MIDLSVQYCNNYCDPTSEYRNNNSFLCKFVEIFSINSNIAFCIASLKIVKEEPSLLAQQLETNFCVAQKQLDLCVLTIQVKRSENPELCPTNFGFFV